MSNNIERGGQLLQQLMQIVFGRSSDSGTLSSEQRTEEATRFISGLSAEDRGSFVQAWNAFLSFCREGLGRSLVGAEREDTTAAPARVPDVRAAGQHQR